MKFGLMYEIPVPRPWHERSAYQAFQETIEQIQLADELGFHSVWCVEHHFLGEYSFSSAPGVFYGTLAAKTKNIRIGHGVRLLPFPYNHPVRAAEAAATVDILSNGRLEFGTGRSGTRIELEGFGIDPRDTRAMWEEALEVIVGCWTNEVFSHEGRFFKLPPREVVPRPLQQPHPPLWGASSSSESHEIIGLKGLGLLSFSVAAPPESLAKRFARYRDAIKQATPVGAYVNEQIATFTQVFCAETTKEAYEIAGPPFEWYVQESLKKIAELGDWKDGSQLGSYEYAKRLLGGIDLESLTFKYLLDNEAVVVGDPDRCIELARRYEAVGTDLLLCLVQPYDIPHEKVLKSIELLGKHVLPAFK